MSENEIISAVVGVVAILVVYLVVRNNRKKGEEELDNTHISNKRPNKR